MNARLTAGVATIALALAAQSAAAGDFTIESKVYNGSEMLGKSTTLFVAGKVYDLLSDPDEAIIFDLAAGRVVFVDNARKVRSETSAVQLEEFCERLRDRARANGSSYLQFMAEPEFREELDPETSELVLTSAFMDYRARTTAPSDAAALGNYQAFVRLQAMVNTMMNPGTAPPYARFKLNEALARRQVLPEEVSMRRKSIVPGFGKSLRAEHQFTWRMGDVDRKRIAEVDEKLGKYKHVALADYLQPIADEAGR